MEDDNIFIFLLHSCTSSFDKCYLAGWGKVIFFCRPSSLQAKEYLLFLGHVLGLSPSPCHISASQPLPTLAPRPCIAHDSFCPGSLLLLSAHEHRPTYSSITLSLAGALFPLPHASVLELALPHKASRRTETEQRSECSGQEVQDIIWHQPLPQLSQLQCVTWTWVPERTKHCKISLPLTLSAVENAHCNHSSPVCPLSLSWAHKFDNISEVFYSFLSVSWVLHIIDLPPFLFGAFSNSLPSFADGSVAPTSP